MIAESAKFQQAWARENGFVVVEMIKGRREGRKFEKMLVLAKSPDDLQVETYELVVANLLDWMRALCSTFAEGSLELVINTLQNEYVVVVGSNVGFGLFQLTNKEFGRGYGPAKY